MEEVWRRGGVGGMEEGRDSRRYGGGVGGMEEGRDVGGM